MLKCRCRWLVINLILLKLFWVQSVDRMKEICKFKDIDDVIPMQPEVPFSTTTVKDLKWFGRELTELWKEKSNDKGRIFIFLAIDPKCQGDLQGYMIFYMTPKLYGLSRSIWPICYSIQHIIGEISANESIMTSYLLDRKWHKKIKKSKSLSFGLY